MAVTSLLPDSSVELVKQTVRSTSTCTNNTVMALQALLRGSSYTTSEIESATVKRAGRSTKNAATTTSRTRTARAGTKTKISVQEAALTTLVEKDAARLSSQEKLILATEIFNTTLKTLSDALKPPSKESTPLKRATKSLAKSKTTENGASEVSSGVAATAECARMSLTCLRTLKSDCGGQADICANLQLEQGACVLAGRLISLGLNDMAYKELRGLKRRIQHWLDGQNTSRKKVADKKASHDDQEDEPAKDRVSDLPFFSNISKAQPLHNLIISFQTNALRLITSERRPATIQKLAPALQISDPSSPASVIMEAVGSGSLTKDKGALQLQSLSNNILSLCSTHHLSSSANASKDQLKPITSLILQLLSLEIRCMSWKFSGHVCEVGKELWDPLSRYLAGFVHASKGIAKSEFASIYKSIVRLQSYISKSQKQSSANPKDNLLVARIAIVLGQLAQDAGCFDEALQLFRESLTPLSTGQCLALATVRCKIASLHFQAVKSSTKLSSSNISSAMREAIAALSLQLKGSNIDLDELLVEAAKLKKLAMCWFGETISKENESKLVENETLPHVYEYLNAFIRFLRRYIGRRPTDNDQVDQEAFQKRVAASQSIIFAALDSAIAVGKLSIMSQRPPWDETVSTLLDCQRILMVIEASQQGQPESTIAENIGIAFVKISNVFWSRYIKEKESGKGCRDLLPLLKQSATLLSTCSPSHRTTGFAALKYERLAHTYLEGNLTSESEQAFHQSIKEHIETGSLEELTSNTLGCFPHRISQDPKSSAFTLGRVLSAYLKAKVRNKKLKTYDVFDDDTLPSSQRGHILEWQMGILSELHPNTYNDEIFRPVFDGLLSKLLEIYLPDEHPIRRLRVFLSALRFALEHPELLDSSLLLRIANEASDSLRNSNASGDDHDIACIGAHLQNSVRLTLSLYRGNLEPDQLDLIISSWNSMVRNCHDWQALVSSVGDVEYYILQMKAVVDYTEIHGLWKLQLSALELVLFVTELQGAGSFSEAILVLSRLVLQYCRLGYCVKAGDLLSRAAQYIGHAEVSCLAKLSYELARAGFLLETGDIQAAAKVLSTARSLYEDNQSTTDLNACSVISKISWERLVADAAFMSSRLSFAQGSIKDALFFAKLSVRLNCRIWAKVEKLAQRKQEKIMAASDNSELEVVVEGMAKLEVSQVPQTSTSSYAQGAPFWPHIGSHHSSLLNLASLSAHYGLFQDAIYYGEQALKINKTLNANVRLIASQAQLGSHWIFGGHLSEGQELLTAAKDLSKQLGNSIELISLQMSLAVLYKAQGNHRDEFQALKDANKLVTDILEPGVSDESSSSSTVLELEDKMGKLRIRPNSRATRQQAATATMTTRRTRGMTTSGRTASKVPAPKAEVSGIDSNTLMHVKSDILRQQAACLRAQREFDKASGLLDDARKFAVTRDSKISVNIGVSEHLLADAIRHFATHAVYCVLPESTISLPSLQTPSLAISESNSLTKPSTTRKTRAPARGTRAKAQKPAEEDFVIMLSKAGDCLNNIFPTATSLGSTLDSHSASRLMSRISMLSNVTAHQPTPWSQSPANVNEIGRIGAFARENAAIDIDKYLAEYCDPLLWPTSSGLTAKPDEDLVSEFTQEYVDILPNNWNVLSLSLSADRTEFIVSRLHQGRSPFLLRLPLKRGNSEDDDEEQFTFDDGREEMQELIKLANESAHAAKAQIDKQAKKEWWRNREALDRRLETLLENIENVWFGGFRGIFSPVCHHASSLARFADSFQTILDKHLPSRQKGGRTEGPRLTLHPNVLELFVAVKDLDSQEDPEETLMDLLYFVVDILQFQGERNAYDEIDFDMMVVETIDAVKIYHEAVKRETAKQKPNNTVLVLDKALHLFPWESLPCLQGFPVCRVPSLECLRDRIVRFRNTNSIRPFGINRRNGTYILNPTGDLQTTQNTFEKELSSLPGWSSSGIVNREPTEEEFKNGLESKSLFLYFGHGSGAQYIRGRAVKRLNQCAVTFLMGCSSGALTEAGEYEPYGTPMNYLHAGCPALVATLWDVTDKDIDRFAKATFEGWGLLECEAQDDKKHKRSTTIRDEDGVTLDAAVSQSRQACVLKYLNGAAPVVYGIPGLFLE